MESKSSNVQRITFRPSTKQSLHEYHTKHPNQRPPKVLLAISRNGNLKRIKEYLSETYSLIEPEDLPVNAPDSEGYDLAIVDSGGYKQFEGLIHSAKQRAEPTFLPTMVILTKVELQNRDQLQGGLVDEFIVTPIDKVEFSERISMLMRARTQALVQQGQLAHLTTHDRVTGLPNFYSMSERLAETILDASILNQSVQVVVLKLTVARIMNSLGHKGLDQAAKICSERLKALLPAGVFLARLTTDTWGLIQPPGQPLDALLEQCQSFQKASEQHLEIDTEFVHVDLTIGVGIYPLDASDGPRTLDCAINAISSASGPKPHFYSQKVQHEALRYIRTETRLRDALEQEQFELWYQPQVRLDDMAISGVEALVRWRLPNGHLAPPGDFISVAESTGLIVPLDRWVIKQACQSMSEWRSQHVKIDRIAVNVSSVDVQKPDFADYVRSQLERCRLPPPTLEIELTESTLFEAGDLSLKKLDELRNLGMDIAIDDFGTGYSSLSYIHRLPINILKIDKSFVQDILTVRSNVAITKTIVWLAKNFNLMTIAEGIETEEQANFLKSLNVDIAQGYYYAKPMPASDFTTWLKDWEARIRHSNV